jgi:hypothetical protein
MPRFDTVHDTAADAVPAPVTVAAGDHPAVRVLDNVRRTEHGLGRCEGSPALVGLKVAADQRVRVTVRLRAGKQAAEWWNLYASPQIDRRHTYQPRLLVVRSQGETRAAVVVARRPGAFAYDWSATVAFDLPPTALDEDGLLVVELAESEASPVPQAAIGVAITSVKVTSAAQPMPPSVTASPVAAPIATVDPGTGPWRFRADRRRSPRPDPAPVNRGAPWGARPSASLRYREKIQALALRKASDALIGTLRALRHLAVRCGRAIAWPFATVITALTIGGVTATLQPIDGGPAIPARVRRRGLTGIEVRPERPLSGPGLLRLPDRFTWVRSR